MANLSRPAENLAIKKLREEQKLSQRELARIVGCSHSSVQNAEAGAAPRCLPRIIQALVERAMQSERRASAASP